MTEALADIIAAAEHARSRADKAIAKYVRSGRISGEALSTVHQSMAAIRIHLAEAERLAAMD